MISTGVYNWFIILWMILAIVVFFILLKIPVPYGKTTRKGWGPFVNPRYGWMFMESAAVISFLFLFILGERKVSVVGIIFFLLWEIHYVNRAFVYPFRIQSTGRKMALSVVFMGFLFNVINGYVNGVFLFSLTRPYPLFWICDIRFILGILLFVGGFIISSVSDSILRSLRKTGSDEYGIPKRFLFRYISCPNYFGEIIEWLGWAFLTWSLGGFSFFVWTCANLIPRAITYHRWYMQKFPQYPRERKALFPYIF